MKPRIWMQHGAWWCALQINGATPAGYGTTPTEAYAAWSWACHGGATLVTADGAAPRLQ